MTDLLTAAQMRAIEAAAIASGKTTGLTMMERAGRGVVDTMFAHWPDLANGAFRAVVFCGPGNNGGDGFVVARLLQEAGWSVDVFLLGDAEKLPPDAKTNYNRWRPMGEVAPMAKFDSTCASKADVCIDAVFGTGLTRGLGDLNAVIRRAFEGDTGPDLRRVAVDVPSGLCADSGLVLDGAGQGSGARSGLEKPAFQAQLTVTFHRAKHGHFLADGPMMCGHVVVADIGLTRKTGVDQTIVHKCRADLGVADKHAQAHKFSHGHALVLSGGAGRTGAARLAARGALRIGAGVVTVGSPPQAMAENAAHLTAIMLTPMQDGDALAQVLTDERITALCLGPGLGIGTRQAGMLDVAVRTRRAAYGLVLDADALTILSQDPALFAALHDRCVLTPHAGEFARLFPDIAERLNAPATKGPAFSKVDATREAAKRAGCTVLFKGPDTVIASPDGRCSINASAYARAAPWLATAGSGDVLAGFITGLVARGFSPHRAAETGAYLHTECALRFGAGLIAEDLPEVLPKVLTHTCLSSGGAAK